MNNKGYSYKSKASVRLISRAASSEGLQGFAENDYWQVKPSYWMSTHCNESRKAILSTASSVAHVDWIVNWAGGKLQHIHAMCFLLLLLFFNVLWKKIYLYILLLLNNVFTDTCPTPHLPPPKKTVKNNNKETTGFLRSLQLIFRYLFLFWFINTRVTCIETF